MSNHTVNPAMLVAVLAMRVARNRLAIFVGGLVVGSIPWWAF